MPVNILQMKSLFWATLLRRTYKEADDIVTAMETGDNMDFDALALVVKILTVNPENNPLGYKMQKMQYAEDYIIDRQS